MSQGPLDYLDYRWDERGPTVPGNRLLESLEGDISPHLEYSETKALAAIAAAIHVNAPSLPPEKLEQAVRWLKLWKLDRKPLTRTHSHMDSAFRRVLDRIRESPEQLVLQNRASSLTLAARGVAVLFGVSLAITVGMFLLEAAWIWRVLGILTAVALLLLSEALINSSMKVAKEQDRRYVFDCIRQAETISELSEAGLFGYLRGAHPVEGLPWNEGEARAAIAKELERLTDALYRDSEGLAGLVHYSHQS